MSQSRCAVTLIASMRPLEEIDALGPIPNTKLPAETALGTAQWTRGRSFSSSTVVTSSGQRVGEIEVAFVGGERERGCASPHEVSTQREVDAVGEPSSQVEGVNEGPAVGASHRA